jgi:IstB-like ATP binding protein
VCAAEVAHREERRISMGLGIAKFPFVRILGFEFDAQPSLDPKQVRDLATCRWVANDDALLLLGHLPQPGQCSPAEPSSRNQRRSAPPILHPAAAATDPLATNNHYSYCRFNTQYMLFPRA